MTCLDVGRTNHPFLPKEGCDRPQCHAVTVPLDHTAIHDDVLDDDVLDRYLARLGVSRPPAADLDSLTTLQAAHLTAVPFENLDVFRGVPVRTDLEWSLGKILDRKRGGWCFELNGACAALLAALGFEVRLLGAAVLLNGPSTVIDHLTIEVRLDEPWLVDVGFGDSFMRPLALNRSEPQDGGSGWFQFFDSPQGTTLTELVDDSGAPSPTGTPEARYRFKRVSHALTDFEPASAALQTDPASPFRAKPFATRLLDGGPDRVTLLRDRLKLHRDGTVKETPVADHAWAGVLHEWFDIDD